MEFIPDHDKYLDPPDIPEYSGCDDCGEHFRTDDLNDAGGKLLCSECYELWEESQDDDE
jgi:formylmethanofuran dehydrogenase subunit E